MPALGQGPSSQTYSGMPGNLYPARPAPSAGVSTFSAFAENFSSNPTPAPNRRDSPLPQPLDDTVASGRSDTPRPGQDNRHGRPRTNTSNSTKPASANPGTVHTIVTLVADGHSRGASVDTDVVMGNTNADGRSNFIDLDGAPREQSTGEDWDIQGHCRNLAEANAKLQEDNAKLQEDYAELLKTVQPSEDKSSAANTHEDDRRNDGLGAKLRRTRNVAPEDSTTKALRAEVSKLKDQLANADASALRYKQLNKENYDLLTSEKKISSKLARSIDDLKLFLADAERSKSELEHRWSSVSHENDTRKREIQTLKQDLAVMESSRDEIANRLNNAVRESNRLSTKLEQTEALLKSRTEELRVAESFLVKYDHVAGEDINNLAQELNLKILDVAAAVSENVTFLSGSKQTPPLDPSAVDEVKDAVGSALYKHLRKKDHSNDSTLVQLALQTALVKLVASFASTWPIPLNSELKQPLWSLYRRICTHGTSQLSCLVLSRDSERNS